MYKTSLPRTVALFLGATMMAAFLPPQPASAQSVSDLFETVFGGMSDATSAYYGGGRSGKRTVRFPEQVAPGQIVVSFADRRLYYIQRRGRAISYPIAAPRPQDRWQGTMRISRKMVNPPWTPTASMRRENPSLPAYVPGGHPRNPLGYRALYLGSSLYRIHGTDAPWTIGRSISKGCIRMYNADVADLYRRAKVGAKVIVNWKRYAG